MNKEMIMGATALLLVSLLSACKDPAPVPPPATNTEFSAKLNAFSQSPFKGTWETGDFIGVACVKDGKIITETIKAGEISNDGKTAQLVSDGTLPSDASAYYAILPESGVSFSGTEGWDVADMSAESIAIPSASIASCKGSSKELQFIDRYALLAFSTDNTQVAYAELAGNKGEFVSKPFIIDFASKDLKENDKAGYSASKTLRRSIKPGETVYFGLYPGLSLAEGYVITAFDAQGNALFTCTSSDALTVAAGNLYTAPGVDPKPEPQPQAVSLKGILPEASAPFKTSWTANDEIELACYVDGELVTEVVRPNSISADGRTAELVSAGAIKEGAEAYYAVLLGTGTMGYGNKTWSTSDLSNDAPAVPSVTVARTVDGSNELNFQNVYSLLQFVVDEPSAARVELKGNAGEAISKNMQVSFSSFAVNGSSVPAFESSAVMSRDIVPGEPACFGLFPGLKFNNGYTLSVYDKNGKQIGYAQSNAYLKVEKGTVYQAPSFFITDPSVKTKGFDPSKIVASFGIVSDVHVNGTTYADKWGRAAGQLKTKALEQDENGLDAMLVAGDLIDQPNNTQLTQFKSAFESVFNPVDVPLIYTVGNHDVPNYRWSATAASDAAYMRNVLGDNYYLADIDQTMRTNYEARHCVVNGYHIFGVTPNGTQPIVYDPAVLTWLDEQLAEVTAANPERYVIILTHPMIANTIYGSLLGEADGIWYSSSAHYWATSALTTILNKYPQVMVFGGHLHFPLNDPRSVWQDNFSVFGCASVRYMAIENGRYENMKSATVMKDCEQFSQGNLLQFDASGNFRLLRMDFYNNAVIGEPLSSDYPTADKAHLAKYKHSSRSLINGAPQLSTFDVNIAQDGSATAVWAAGSDDEFVHHYVLSLKKDGSVIKTWKHLADFYLYPLPSQMKTSWSQSLGSLEDGKYEVELVAYDSWDAQSNVLTRTVSVGARTEKNWSDDAAGSKTLSAGSGSVSSDWLSYSDGRVSWTANESGKPRVASISLPDGTVYQHTQLSVQDFKGSWTLKSSQFGGRGNYFSRNAKASTVVTVGDPLSTEKLVFGTEEIANNLGIRGLAANLVMDACVMIDYAGQTVRLGLFMDGRKAQKITEGALKDTYGAFLAELEGSNWGQYEFGRTDLGDPDYDWLWMTTSIGNGSIEAKYLPHTQKISSKHSYKRDTIIGIEVMNFTSESADEASLVRSTTSKNTESGAYQADWITIYQANYGTSDANGMTLIRN